MRLKPTRSPLAGIKSFAGPAVLLCLAVSLIVAMPQDLPDPSIPLNIPKFCRSTNDIKAYFEKQGIPVELKDAKGKSETYFFVLAHRYSGMDTTDLYCYLQRGDGWVMFLTAVLWKTRHNSVEFQPDGDFMNVVRNGTVVLKLNPPK